MSKSFAFSIALLLIIASNSLYSQKFGIEAGYVQHERYGDQFKTTYFNGAKLGLNVEFGLKNNFSLLSGALYSVVYSSNTQNYTVSDSVNYKTFNHTIEVPLHLQYTLPVSKNLKFFAFAGPKLNFGLAQPQKVTVVLSGKHDLLS